ncbi:MULTISPECIES: hypothetical protein [Bacillus]|uniref:hypothetical protein n=1 Tax=Bacillus TaxID=1386 RepID=UPI00020599FC|nr:hypothetical protein [Bacillus amyloliquefaciens]AEB25074.1 hypothetical protein BAMTA208_14565 [Bacillus amyloliquefaciens TA208]AEB64582.1 hypothetical protein LL3_03051 [Bacillus amyloliquefaciens LL3]AEK90105.1 hypothetical protein BAXH7_02981 [Bacillus amyloliquefaciens XH7]KYC93518.1 hypothetical protein B425_2952 [Bacillus amyloliquefaciens]MBW8280172.1 hypothetical protein [Bacillus amyloliquefaciens]
MPENVRAVHAAEDGRTVHIVHAAKDGRTVHTAHAAEDGRAGHVVRIAQDGPIKSTALPASAVSNADYKNYDVQ